MTDTTNNPLFQNFPLPAQQSQPEGIGEAIAQGIEQNAPANGRKKRKSAAKKAGVKKTPVKKVPAAAKLPRKRQQALAPAPKFDMLRILQATAGLKEADMKMFESLAAAFVAMGKPTRARILPAIQKLFA